MEERGDAYYVNRFFAWGKTQTGLVTTEVGGVPVKWLKEGVEIELLDNGVRIYQETSTGTSGEITLTGALATQGNIETAIQIAMKGTN